MPIYARIEDGRIAEVLRVTSSELPADQLTEYVDISGLDPTPRVGWAPKHGMSFQPAVMPAPTPENGS
jgi:hypothetical protein